MLQPKSLQNKFAIYMLLPVTLLLIGMGVAGYLYSRDKLLAQWREAAILSLQQSAHQIDMRLNSIKEWIRIFHKTGKSTHRHLIHAWVVEQIRELDGVEEVVLDWRNDNPGQAVGKTPQHMNMKLDEYREMMEFQGTHITTVTAPIFNTDGNNKEVSLISDLKDDRDRTIGQLKVRIDFEYLIKNIVESGWWQGHKAFLVDNMGVILAGTGSAQRRSLGVNEDSLERRALIGIMTMTYGTFIEKGFFPSEVSGFYKLQEAPWNLVMIAPGEKVLSSLIQFRRYYLVIGGAFVLLILLLIRSVTGQTVTSINEISQAAGRVARGDFKQPLTVRTKDEMGELTSSFNMMMAGLEERSQLVAAMDLAKEVQQNLLPQKTVRIGNLDIAGKSIYCDETGGDYFDFLHFPEFGRDRVAVAVGDVVGHGIAAALLMTTARALIRCRVIQPGSISIMMKDINRLLSMDTADSGDFMTLFFLVIDQSEGELHWVRAGHDPAIVYDSNTDSFTELNGKGTALGVDATQTFQAYTHSGWRQGQIVLIGTDGIWEATNAGGEHFGKEEVKQLICRHKEKTSEEIIRVITNRLKEFRGNADQEDDITLAMIKYA